MSAQNLDWRELKKELFSQPRPRTSNTFIHNDIFNSKATKDEYNLNNPTDQEQIGRPRYKTPSKIRENDTTKSHLLTNEQEERPSRSQGKRTYEARPTIHPGQPERAVPVNKNRIPDHNPQWFFSVEVQPQSSRQTQEQQGQDISQNPQPVQEARSISPHRQKKQEELYRTEVAEQHLMEPDSTKLNVIPRSKSQLRINQDSIQRSLSPEAHPKEKRLLHNESNLFNIANFESKVRSAKKQPAETASEVSTTPQKVVKDEENLVQNIVDQQIKSTAFSQEEINRIKRLNHNFSDVFGLEYGSREALQIKKQEARELSPYLEWVNVDSIKNKKDIGAKHQEKTVRMNLNEQLNKSRSRVSDQRSTLDTHNEYDKPTQKTQRTQVTRNVISRSNQKPR